MSDTNHSLVCPFLNENPDYACGVEFGMLFVRMKTETRIDDCFTVRNQDQILLLASRSGWSVLQMRKIDKFWFQIVMEKAGE